MSNLLRRAMKVTMYIALAAIAFVVSWFLSGSRSLGTSEKGSESSAFLVAPFAHADAPYSQASYGGGDSQASDGGGYSQASYGGGYSQATYYSQANYYSEGAYYAEGAYGGGGGGEGGGSGEGSSCG